MDLPPKQKANGSGKSMKIFEMIQYNQIDGRNKFRTLTLIYRGSQKETDETLEYDYKKKHVKKIKLILEGKTNATNQAVYGIRRTPAVKEIK